MTGTAMTPATMTRVALTPVTMTRVALTPATMTLAAMTGPLASDHRQAPPRTCRQTTRPSPSQTQRQFLWAPEGVS